MDCTALWIGPLDAALEANKEIPSSRFMQLATVKPDGTPSNRTVVFRGFLGSTHRLHFYADVRTRKVQEIASNPWAEIVFYFTGTHEQFRVLGKLQTITKDEKDEALQQARTAAWEGMSNEDPGRQHPHWPQPRTPRVKDGSVFEDRETRADEVCENFMLVTLEVEEVDHYALAANRRVIYFQGAADNGSAHWVAEDINP